MATDPRYATGHNGHRVMEDLAVAEDHEGWLARSRVMLTPIAAPSIMGLFGFAMATVMLGAYQAGWYGSAVTPLVIWPLALFAGGIMQSIAAIASFRARDGAAVAVHTAWGSFWVGWGILQLLVATHVMAAIPLGATSPSFAMWFVVLTLVTFWGAIGALAQNMIVFVTLGTILLIACVAMAVATAGHAVPRRGSYLPAAGRAAAHSAAYPPGAHSSAG